MEMDDKKKLVSECVSKALTELGPTAPVTDLHDEAMDEVFDRVPTVSDVIYCELAEMVNEELDGKLE